MPRISSISCGLGFFPSTVRAGSPAARRNSTKVRIRTPPMISREYRILFSAYRNILRIYLLSCCKHRTKTLNLYPDFTKGKRHEAFFRNILDHFAPDGAVGLSFRAVSVPRGKKIPGPSLRGPLNVLMGAGNGLRGTHETSCAPGAPPRQRLPYRDHHTGGGRRPPGIRSKTGKTALCPHHDPAITAESNRIPVPSRI